MVVNKGAPNVFVMEAEVQDYGCTASTFKQTGVKYAIQLLDHP